MKAIVRCVAVVGALVTAGVVLRWATAGTLAQLSADDFGSLTGLVTAGVAWAAYGWLALAVGLTALERLPGVLGRVAAAVARMITSDGSHVLLRSALGVAVATPLTVGIAHAEPGDGANSVRWGAVEKASSVPGAQPTPRRDRLAIPDRPTVGAQTRYTPIRPAASSVLVRRGDSLWSIAARELGPVASDAAIARRWPRWYAANAARIGPDPDLIHPGQLLDHPTTPQSMPHQEN
jgi:nucleoid-associated protein YgaU